MTASRQTKKLWASKLEKLEDAAERAAEDLLVGMHEATEAGLSQADVAYPLRKCSPSGVKAKADRGKAILELRKGGKKPS